MSVNTRRQGRVGYVEIDSPPVNAIGLSVRQGLLEAVSWAESQRLERIIISGKGRIFAAGADAREFDSAPVEPHLPDVLKAIEESAVPWIAAINGSALGGGAEIALACRMRIMSPKASIGLPEVNLGVIPGAGGTQRLPRLVGLSAALDIITGGKSVSAHDALLSGLVHSIDDDAIDAAFNVNSSKLLSHLPVGELPCPAMDSAIVDPVRKRVQTKSRGQLAPLRAIDVIEKSLNLTLDEGLALERQAFLELRSTKQAKALRHIFFAEKGAKAPQSINAEAVDPAHVVVVGGGTMGSGIAYSLLNAGLKVTVIENDDSGVQRAQDNMSSIVAASLKRGLIDEHDADDRKARFKATIAYSDASDAVLAIEAAFESMEVKKIVFRALDEVLPGRAILATNTSYLDLDEIAACVSDPTRVIGLHFFAPAHVMKLLEIVRGDLTSDTAIATGFSLAKSLRKIPVMVGVCDGFVGNRILARYREAADTVLIDGSTPWEIDDAMVEFGYAMGPYTAQDLSGLDIAHANRRRQDATRDPHRRYITIADRMVELGRLGRKTGAGWYRYSSGEGRLEDPIVADLAIEEARCASVERVVYSADEIRDRLLLAMINEAADILDEGIAESAKDIDLVTVFGYGFPRWRGGLMHYADSLGVNTIVNRLQELFEEDPVAWKMSPLLRRCADSGVSLAES